jgi:hypothetical protein
MPISEEQDPEKQSSPREDKPRRRGSKRADLVERAIESIEQKLGSSDVKATFADFIRLLQLQKELQVDEPREIKVTWIDPNEQESASEE